MTRPNFAYRLDGDAYTEDQVRVLVAFVRLEKADGRSEDWRGQFGISNVMLVTTLSRQRLQLIFAQLDDRGLIRYTCNAMYRLTTRGVNHAQQLIAWENQKP